MRKLRPQEDQFELPTWALSCRAHTFGAILLVNMSLQIEPPNSQSKRKGHLLVGFGPIQPDAWDHSPKHSCNDNGQAYSSSVHFFPLGKKTTSHKDQPVTGHRQSTVTVRWRGKGKEPWLHESRFSECIGARQPVRSCQWGENPRTDAPPNTFLEP